MLNIILFVLYFVKYALFMTGILHKEIRRWWIAGAGFGVWVVLCAVGVVNDGTWSYLFSAVVLICIFFMANGKSRKKLIEIFLMYTIVSSFGDIIDTIVNLVTRLTTYNVDGMTTVDKIISNIVVICFIIIICMIQHRKRDVKEKKIPVSAAYIAISITVWMVDLVITSLHYFQHYIYDKSGIIIMHIVEVMALISVLILIIVVYYIYNMNHQIQRMNENEREARVMQKLFYEKLLEKEEDTRRFRHDMTNQLLCFQALLQKGDMEEVKKHVELLNQSLREIHEQVYVTGNDILDIMINYYKDKLKKDADIKVLGGLSGNIKADSVEQCIIFSNVIKNAVEEINRGNFEHPFLTIRIENGDEMAGIIVENSSEEKKEDKGRFKTSKKDSKNHGIGVTNLKEAVSKNKGVCQLQYKEGMFVSKIYLPVEYT